MYPQGNPKNRRKPTKYPKDIPITLYLFIMFLIKGVYAFVYQILLFGKKILLTNHLFMVKMLNKQEFVKLT